MAVLPPELKRVIKSQLAARDSSQASIENFIRSHHRVVERLKESLATKSEVEQSIEILKEENKQLRRENLRASTSRGASAEIAVELEAKDKKIADLQSEMLEMLKNQNQEKKEEVELHRRVKQLTDALAQKTAACERLTQTSSRFEVQAERYKAELEQRDVEFKTLEDEHSVLKLEATLAQEQLQAKRQELDDLLSRWVKEKQAAADQMNDDNQKVSDEAQSRITSELLAAAAAAPLDDAQGSFLDIGGNVVLPTRVVLREQAHSAEIFTGVYSRDSSSFATGSSDRMVKIWTSSGTLSNTLKSLTSTVSCLAFTMDSTAIAVGTEGGRVSIHSVGLTSKKNLLHEMNNHTNRVNSIAFCPTSETLYSASKDHTIKAFDTKRGALKSNALSDSTCQALCAADAYRLITAHFDKTIKIRDPREDLKTVGFEFESGHTAHITHMCVHPDSYKVLTSAKDHTLREHDLRMHSTIRTFLHEDFRLGPSGCQPCYSPNGAYVACGSVSGTVVVWDANSGSLEQKLEGGHTRDVMACSWKLSGSEMLTVAKDKHFAIWG